jgi:hypothetical protein
LKTQAGFPIAGSPAFCFLEGIMLDLKNCVNYDGSIYYRHPFTNSIVKIELKRAPVKYCPDMVIDALLKSAFGESRKRE